MSSEHGLPPAIAETTHALLLQGPAGPFMRRFAEDLRDHGIRVTKVNFHAGDVLFFPGADAVSYREPFDKWPGWIRRLMLERSIDAIFLFGDCRPLHEAAVAEANKLGIRVWVFEEGYLRPDWITVEEHGVNGKSHIHRDADAYHSVESERPDRKKVPKSAFRYNAWYSTLNALAFTLFNQRFPHYTHHRNLNAWYHAAGWVIGSYRKLHFARKEKPTLEELKTTLSKRYFLVPLQVHCDFQLRYSPYTDVVDFILDMVDAFQAHAADDDYLVFKHHPMDRAYRDYTHFFRHLQRRCPRIRYVHDLHLPTLIEHAKGTITINSTVGLESLRRGTPTLTIGGAVYSFRGMTAQDGLETFLRDPGEVDRRLVESFCRWLLGNSQANGSYYVQVEDLRRGTGIRWWPTARHGAPQTLSESPPSNPTIAS